jgi:hypothetical protein
VTALLALLQSLWPVMRSYWSYGALAVVSLLAWHFDSRAIANADAVRTQAEQFKQANAVATQAWTEKLTAQQTEYAKDATNAQASFQGTLATVQTATAAYVASHRAVIVRDETAAGGPGAANGVAQAVNTAFPESVPTGGLVAVSGADVQSCSDATAYAVKAHDWAMSLGQ